MRTETDEVLYVPINVLQSFAEQVFVSLGTPSKDASICAEVLIASDRRGIESHGIGRLKVYYDRIKAGVQRVETEIEIVQETTTTALVDGHHGMGAVIAHRSMRLAMDKARQHGIGAVAVRNSTHFGIAGYYALMAAQEGMMGFAPDGARRPYMLGHFFLAIDIEHFVPLEMSKRITGQIMRDLQGARKTPGQERIYVAGEKEHERQEIVRLRGITVNRNLRRDLQSVRDELGISGYEAYF